MQGGVGGGRNGGVAVAVGGRGVVGQRGRGRHHQPGRRLAPLKVQVGARGDDLVVAGGQCVGGRVFFGGAVERGGGVSPLLRVRRHRRRAHAQLEQRVARLDEGEGGAFREFVRRGFKERRRALVARRGVERGLHLVPRGGRHVERAVGVDAQLVAEEGGEVEEPRVEVGGPGGGGAVGPTLRRLRRRQLALQLGQLGLARRDRVGEAGGLVGGRLRNVGLGRDRHQLELDGRAGRGRRRARGRDVGLARHARGRGAGRREFERRGPRGGDPRAHRVQEVGVRGGGVELQPHRFPGRRREARVDRARVARRGGGRRRRRRDPVGRRPPPADRRAQPPLHLVQLRVGGVGLGGLDRVRVRLLESAERLPRARPARQRQHVPGHRVQGGVALVARRPWGGP